MNMQRFLAFILIGYLVTGRAMGMEEGPMIPKGKEEESDSVTEEVINLDGHKEAREFHKRLIREHPEWFEGNVQSYYKRIDPIRSTPQTPGGNGWNITGISIDGNRVIPDSNGTCAHNGISINLNSLKNFDQSKAFTFPIVHNMEQTNVRFTLVSQTKIPISSRFDDYETFMTKMRDNKFSLRQKTTFRGITCITGERPHTIQIEVKNKQREPLVFQGVEFVFNKTEGRTLIVFDCVDRALEPVEFIHPKESNHASIIAEQSVFCIKDHRVFKCEGKTLSNFFTSPETRRKWVPDESNFYDLMNNRVVHLPSCYSLSEEHERNADEDPAIWALNGNHGSFYQVEALEMQNETDYLHCDNEVFYALSPFRATCKEYLSQDPRNKLRFDYLVQVKKPGFRIHPDANLEGGDRPWASGLYKRVRIGDSIQWHQIAPGTDLINFDTSKTAIDIMWPNEPLNVQEIKKWGDAAQRFFILFNACIHQCDREIANKLSAWNKLNCVDLSRLRLTQDINWNNLLTAIGSMRQLQQLGFAYNHPIADILDEESYFEADNFYINLADCLSRLINLKNLYIQGLWLKDQYQLNAEYEDENLVLTDEINHLTNFIAGQGPIIRTLLNRICQLPHLGCLNIDGLPNHGSSTWSKEDLITRLMYAMSYPSNCLEDMAQNESLQQLLKDSADTIAQIPSLRSLSVYSPGGNCLNYFSQAFRAHLAATRAAHSNLQPLTINAGVLQ